VKPLALKSHLKQGKVAVGTWIFEFNSPGLARLLGTTGVDFAALDMEHSGLGIESIRSMVGQSRNLDLAVLVRPPAAQYHLIAPLLDIGASGVIAPMVETAEAAARVAEACRYSPEGRRGAAFSIAHDDYRPGDVAAKIKTANDEVVCSLLIETDRAIAHLDEITSVPGIDLIWVGHFDLSITMGIPGQFEHPRFLEAIQHILGTCKSRGLPVGIMVTDPAQAMQRVREGFRCLTYWGDIWLLQWVLLSGVQTIREAISKESLDA
jgi:2-keto-3-deoxy-L-rhamnonate aldolase RhmA